MTLDPEQTAKLREKAPANPAEDGAQSPLRSTVDAGIWPGRLAVYPLLSKPEQLGFHETWTIRVQDSEHTRGFFLRVRLLTSRNGFQKQIVTRAVLFSRAGGSREPIVQGFSSQQELRNFRVTDTGQIQFKEQSLDFSAAEGPWSVQGSMLSRGQRLLWDLNLARPDGREPSASSWVPLTLHKGRLLQNRSVTLAADWLAHGFCQVQGEERWDFSNARVELIHEYGPSLPESWTWGHCADFVHEDGTPAEDLVFEGCTLELPLALGLNLPKLSTFAIRYQGKIHRMNSLWASLRSRVDSGHHHWKFHVDEGELSFRGDVQAESRDFGGFTEEDCDGSIIHIATALHARLTLRVYRNSQLERTYRSAAGAALEFGTRSRNPYVRDLF